MRGSHRPDLGELPDNEGDRPKHGQVMAQPFTVSICKGGQVIHREEILIGCRWDEEVDQWILTPSAHSTIERVQAWWMGKLGVELKYAKPRSL